MLFVVLLFVLPLDAINYIDSDFFPSHDTDTDTSLCININNISVGLGFLVSEEQYKVDQAIHHNSMP